MTTLAGITIVDQIRSGDFPVEFVLLLYYRIFLTHDLGNANMVSQFGNRSLCNRVGLCAE